MLPAKAVFFSSKKSRMYQLRWAEGTGAPREPEKLRGSSSQAAPAI